MESLKQYIQALKLKLARQEKALDNIAEKARQIVQAEKDKRKKALARIYNR